MTGPSLSPKQMAAVVGCDARLNVLYGSVRSGKTLASTIAWLNFIATGPPGKLLMVGKTLATLEQNVLDPMADLFPARVRESAVKHTRGATTAIILGRLVHCRGANDAKAQGTIQGLTLIGAYVDEATLIPEGFFRMLLSRLSLPGARLLATTNPDSPNHWLKTDFLDKPDLKVRQFQFRLPDNPSLSDEYLTAIHNEYTGLWRLRYIDGLWTIAAGVIYAMWNPDLYVSKEEPEALAALTRQLDPIWVGLDYGTARSAFSALLMGVGRDKRIHVVGEKRWAPLETQRQKTNAEYSQDLTDWLVELEVNPDWIFVDPSAASFKIQLRNDGYGAGVVRGASNEVLEGLRICTSAMAGDRIRIHKSCTGLINEIPGYVWDPAAQDEGKDEPVKKNDDGVDSLRYGLVSTRHVWTGLPVAEAA